MKNQYSIFLCFFEMACELCNNLLPNVHKKSDLSEFVLAGAESHASAKLDCSDTTLLGAQRQ